jgi:hypothetical protein
MCAQGGQNTEPVHFQPKLLVFLGRLPKSVIAFL